MISQINNNPSISQTLRGFLNKLTLSTETTAKIADVSKKIFIVLATVLAAPIVAGISVAGFAVGLVADIIFTPFKLGLRIKTDHPFTVTEYFSRSCPELFRDAVSYAWYGTPA